MIAARSSPAASMTTRMSSTRCSSDGGPATGSDSPVPGLSNITSRQNEVSRRSIALYRNTTEAINAVMHMMLTEVRDGDNVVTTLMEHNSDYVPWYAMCREILPRFGRRVQCRLARFDLDSPDPSAEFLRLDRLRDRWLEVRDRCHSVPLIEGTVAEWAAWTGLA